MKKEVMIEAIQLTLTEMAGEDHLKPKLFAEIETELRILLTKSTLSVFETELLGEVAEVIKLTLKDNKPH